MKKVVAGALLIGMCMLIFTCSGDEELVTVNFSVEYVPVYPSIKDCEVIILSADDKTVLERMVIPSNTKHSFSVQSPTDHVTLVVIDSLHWNGLPPTFSIRAFRDITPGNWKIPSEGIPFQEQLTGDGPDAVPGNDAVFNYINVPDFDDTEFHNKPVFVISNGGAAWNVLHENHSAFATFVTDRPMPIDYTYLLLPALGKYKFTDPASTTSQIDLTQMKDAKKVLFDGLESVTTKGQFGLIAHTDTDRWLMLGVGYPGWDLLYPEEDFIKKYELSFTGWSFRTYYEYYGLVSNVPSSLEIIDESHYTLNRSGAVMDLTFPKEKPTYYYLVYTGSNIRFTIYSPAEVTHTDPVEFINTMNSELMNVRNLTLEPITLGLTSVEPMDYQRYWTYVLTPGNVKAKLITKWNTYALDFRQ